METNTINYNKNTEKKIVVDGIILEQVNHFEYME